MVEVLSQTVYYANFIVILRLDNNYYVDQYLIFITCTLLIKTMFRHHSTCLTRDMKTACIQCQVVQLCVEISTECALIS